MSRRSSDEGQSIGNIYKPKRRSYASQAAKVQEKVKKRKGKGKARAKARETLPKYHAGSTAQHLKGVARVPLASSSTAETAGAVALTRPLLNPVLWAMV